jgi:hypothetical protein
MPAEDRQSDDPMRRRMQPPQEAATSPPKKPAVGQLVPREGEEEMQLQVQQDADKEAVTQPGAPARPETRKARSALTAPAARKGGAKPDLGKRGEEGEERTTRLGRAKDLDRLVAKYRVRFLLKIVDSDVAGVAASAAPEAAKAEIAADAEVEPPAEAAEAIRTPALQAPEPPQGEP